MRKHQFSATVGGLSFNVIEWGAADAKPIVMLHGIRGYAETFVGVAEALQAKHRVIAYDQRGRGLTDWDPQRNYYNDAYVADLEGVANALKLEKFDLLGHSMGGMASIVFAATNPDRIDRLVIEDAGPGAFDNSAGASRIRTELSTMPLEFASWEAATDYMRALRPSVTEEARQQRLRYMLKPRSSGGFDWRYDHAGIAAVRLNPDPQRRVDLVPFVRALRCKTLVLRGQRTDYLQPAMAEEMKALNPLIEVVEIADAGHYIHDDQPALFANAVRAFLDAP
jgi:pimeloyl-ACP methyl ester carboxylesterase